MKTEYKIYFTIFAAILSIAFGIVSSSAEEEGVCARVRIQISQDVAITRTAFKATLEIDNAPENVAIEDLTVTLDIKNWNEQDSNYLFAVDEPELTGLADVNGDGVIEPGESGKAVWIIIPTRDAAPEAPTPYFVGGTLSYTQSGTLITIPLFPASITVKPDPLLVLNYFLPREVYSDDPFTKDVVEPIEPFSLGLIMTNQGKGTAKKVRISSAQPKIIENEKGLLIDFKITGTQVNTETVSPSLTVDLGEIAPANTAVAQWIMTSTLSGKFIKDESMATFEHIDEIGDKRTSLIESVSIKESVHTVRVDLPDDENLPDKSMLDDKKPDFLVNDIEDEDHLPDTLYNSNGSTSPVNVVDDAAIDGALSKTNHEIKLYGTAPDGWVYIKINDPSEGLFKLKKVVRSDGREIFVNNSTKGDNTGGGNAWTTNRTVRLAGESPYKESLLHIFDYADSGSFEYSLLFDVSSQILNNYKVLTDSSPSLDIESGENIKVYGSSGINTLNISSDAKVECVNFPGANVINLVDDSASDFTVHRSGAMVYFESSVTGTTLKIPATKTTQSINFNGGVGYNLVISNGKVLLNTQEVTLVKVQL